MKHYLVIANQTIVDAALREAIVERISGGPCRFHVLVPATPARDHLTWTEGEARAIAGRRVAMAVGLIEALGAPVDGEIGDASPLVAAADVLRRDPVYDEIILSTFPAGVSRWLKMDLPQRLRRFFDLPVHHVVAGALSRDEAHQARS